MCLMVYLGAKKPLNLIAWNDAAPAFHVSGLRDEESPVRNQFSMPYVYYAGSHEKCGCGFQYGQYRHVYYETEDQERKRESLDALSGYLSRQISRVGPIELYACWDGDQSALPEHRRTLTPHSLMSEDFQFLENELSTVTWKP
jgi:hypothetical protein